MDCMAKLLNKDGLQNGLYQGINAKLVQTVLTAAFQFLTYEQIQLANRQIVPDVIGQYYRDLHTFLDTLKT